MIVEGAFDVAAAVTTAGDGKLIGLAPCGTALTPHQLATLAGTRAAGLEGLVLGFDDDSAGRDAVARAWELLTPAIAAASRHVRWGPAKDSAELAARAGTESVAAAITTARPLSATIVEQYLNDVDLSTVEGRVWAARRVAATVVPTLQRATVDEAGAAFARALVDAGQPAEAADEAWLITQTEALVAQSLANDHDADGPPSGPPTADLRRVPASSPEID